MKQEQTRKYWLVTLLRIVHPVFFALSEDSLTQTMSQEGKDLQKYTPAVTGLEALGRSLTGIAPWLNCHDLNGEEETLRKEYADMCRKAIANGVNPKAKDFLNFEQGNQCLVDTAFLCHGLLRAPEELWEKLQSEDKENLIAALKSTRSRKPYASNWLLFSAMIEAFLYRAGEKDWDPMRIDYALRQHEQWYKGDGVYGDGPNFHADYYNSFVIQPMLVDILEAVGHTNADWQAMGENIRRRATRYSEILERSISPEGTYPPLGRSLTYRFGCFQMLSQTALQNRLPQELSYEQVRCALTAVIERVMTFDNFDISGFLKIGVCGSQPSLGEYYITTGSEYLCSAVFLPLGLPPAHPFWSHPNAPWTAVKIFGGQDMPCDHGI